MKNITMRLHSFLKSNKLLYDFVNYFSGRLLTKGLVFLSIPIFSALLTPKEYGTVAVFFSFFLITSVLFQLNLSGAIRQYILKSNKNTKNYIFSLLIFIVLLYTILIPLLYFLKNAISIYFQINIEIYYMIIIGTIFNTFILFYEFYLLGVNDSKRYSFFSFIRAFTEILFSLFFIFFIFIEKDIARISGIVLAYFIFGIYSLVRLIAFINNNYKFKMFYIKYALSFSIPLIVHQLSSVILAQADRVIINKLLSYTQVGLYSMAYNIGMIIQVIVIAFNSAWLPLFYKLMRKKDYKQINYKLIYNFKILIIISIISSIALNLLVPYIISSNYKDSFDIIHIIIMGSVLNYVYLMYANFSFYNNKTWYISLGTILAAIINIVLNFLLIPLYGYKIAAITTIISYFALTFFHYIISKLILKAPVVQIKQVSILLTLYIAWGIIYTLLNKNHHFLKTGYELLSFATIIFLIYKVYYKQWIN